jgi:hypothetical protein
MGEKLSDAARLYLNDFDVLNEAHQEVMELFNSVWKACIREINGSEDEKNLKPKDFVGRKVTGMWSKNQTSDWSGKMYLWFINGLSAVVADPTRDGQERKSFVVGIEATRGWIAQMKAGGGDGKTATSRVADARGISVNWDDHTWFVRAPAIEIDIDAPEKTGRDVADKLDEMLKHIDAIRQAADSIGASLPTDPGLPPEVGERV